MGILHGLEEDLEKAEDYLDSAEAAVINCHRDADGLCGAAIIKDLLESHGVSCRIRGVLPNDLDKIEVFRGLNLFVDIGSGQIPLLAPRFSGSQTVIVDHHPPHGRSWKGLVHLNPHRIGADGSTEVSGAGMAYLLARETSGDREMARVGVIGAVADRQDILGELGGMNREILQDAVEEDQVEELKDVLLFGRESKPLHLALKSLTDPPIPGVSGMEAGSMQLLSDLGIPLKEGKGFRTLDDLTHDERRALASELIVRCMSLVSPKVSRYVPNLIIGSVYRMLGEQPPLQYAKEFATCINSAARMGLLEDVVDMLRGDRGDHYDRVMCGLKRYRLSLSENIRSVSSRGIDLAEGGYLQYFKSERTPKYILGPVTGLLLGEGVADPMKPLAGMVSEGSTKASVRCSRLLVLEGIDLSECVRKAAQSVGGEGGGHRGAAGAFFRAGFEERFVKRLEMGLLEQVESMGIESVP